MFCCFIKAFSRYVSLELVNLQRHNIKKKIIKFLNAIFLLFRCRSLMISKASVLRKLKWYLFKNKVYVFQTSTVNNPVFFYSFETFIHPVQHPVLQTCQKLIWLRRMKMKNEKLNFKAFHKNGGNGFIVNRCWWKFLFVWMIKNLCCLCRALNVTQHNVLKKFQRKQEIFLKVLKLISFTCHKLNYYISRIEILIFWNSWHWKFVLSLGKLFRQLFAMEF